MKFDDHSKKKTWNKIRENILKDDKKLVPRIKRYNILKTASKEDFLTKLDIIDSHPEVFDSKHKDVKLSKEELEQLRVLVVGDQKLFASR